MRALILMVSSLATVAVIGCAHERPRAAVAPAPQTAQPAGTATVTTVTETTSVTVVRRPPPQSRGNGINGVDGANYGGDSTPTATHAPP